MSGNLNTIDDELRVGIGKQSENNGRKRIFEYTDLNRLLEEAE